MSRKREDEAGEEAAEETIVAGEVEEIIEGTATNSLDHI